MHEVLLIMTEKGKKEGKRPTCRKVPAASQSFKVSLGPEERPPPISTSLRDTKKTLLGSYFTSSLKNFIMVLTIPMFLTILCQ